MITNYENQKERIDAILNSNDSIAIDIDTNEITACRGLACSRCLFFDKDNGCYRNTIKWLVAEYTESEVDWNKVPVDTPVLVSNNKKFWYSRYFAGVDDDGRLFIFPNGRTSWSNKGISRTIMPYKYIKLAKTEVE